ncbi:uncharacterized protein LOC110859858 [Folsomia candida]|uniref:uncharacterized protein LOC110859858 n=1 Tax=Folsomia candida TaxID=158441 RepID=UPI0016055EE2|nr:uncharacterized protein LOC110859858 [Folsomia candida]
MINPMDSIRLITYSATFLVGTALIGGSIHFFRCNSADSLKYPNGSVLGYYCPVVNESAAAAIIEEIEKQDKYYDEKDDAVPDTFLRLGKHDVYMDQITLSGFSSGATFAQQMFISHSALFTGIASFSHAYYRCGPGNGREADYDNACTTIGTNQSYNLDNALDDIRSYEQRRLIDSTGNLRNKKLYVYAGARSQIFSLDQSLGAVSIFEPFIKSSKYIKTVVQDATQLLPSDKFGAPCTMSAEQNFFIGNCGFSGAADSLSFLLGDAIRQPGHSTRARHQQLLTFDQTEFFYGYNGPEYMDSKGFIYVPRHCHRQRCYLHFYFHGCLSGREFNGTDHIVNSGFLEVAEANNLIVVFPQAWSSMPENMIGCWDTYGLTSSLYATRQGPQITVIRNMLSRLLGMDNEVPDVPDHAVKIREREPLGIEFEIVKGREVYLR